MNGAENHPHDGNAEEPHRTPLAQQQPDGARQREPNGDRPTGDRPCGDAVVDVIKHLRFEFPHVELELELRGQVIESPDRVPQQRQHADDPQVDRGPHRNTATRFCSNHGLSPFLSRAKLLAIRYHVAIGTGWRDQAESKNHESVGNWLSNDSSLRSRYRPLTASSRRAGRSKVQFTDYRCSFNRCRMPNPKTRSQMSSTRTPADRDVVFQEIH